MTVYLVMKNFNATDYDEVDWSMPIGYLLSEEKANERVKALNDEIENLKIQQQKLREKLIAWKINNPNPRYFNKNGSKKNKKERSTKESIEDINLYEDWQKRYREEEESGGINIWQVFDKINYSVEILNSLE